MKNIDHYYMQHALEIAKRSRLYVSPNPMVGCIITKNARVVGEGWHKYYGDAHAEINALKQAKDKAKGSIVYVTLEPCCHTGKTGPCTQALINAKVAKVIVATLDPNPLIAGNGIRQLKDAGIDVEVGMLESQAREINKVFFHFHEKKRPFVYAKWAMSLDGRIAVNANDDKKLSSDKTNRLTHELRNTVDAILIGSNTLKQDNPKLDVRINLKHKKNPTRFVLFSNISEIDESWNILDQNTAKTIFVCSQISSEIQNKLNGLGVDVWVFDNSENYLNHLIEKMANIGITSLLVEGGQKVLDSFISNNRVDEYISYICPSVISNLENKKNLNTKSYKSGADFIISAVVDRRS